MRAKAASEEALTGTGNERSGGRDKDATRQRILDAAEEVFAEKGYHGTVVDDIIQKARTSKGGFYFHFPSKQGIFLALIDVLAPKLMAAVDRAIEDEDTATGKVNAALRIVLEQFSRHRRLSKILLVEAVGLGHGFDEKIVEIHGQFAGMIQRYLDLAVAEGVIEPLDTTVAAYAWFGAINEVVVRWLVTPNPEPLEHSLPTLRALLLRSVGMPVAP
ncbi:MAG TPA: TetR/AcrR family transcriptional regulator [Ktedonobacterales bacterium]|nr:TetR/AcrR family transcriptional regulator [Ktedonobacterales bacterium]